MDIEVKTAELAELLGLDPRRIQQLAKERIITARKKGNVYYFERNKSVQEYIQYIKENPFYDETKNGETGDAGNLIQAKLQAEVNYKEAQAAIKQYEMQELKGQLHRSEDIAYLVGDFMVNVRSALCALPGQLAQDVAREDNPVYTAVIIEKATNRILNTLSAYAYDKEKYVQLARERKGYTAEEGAP